MEIIAIACKVKSKSVLDNSIYTIFIKPDWAGNHIVEAKLAIPEIELEDFDIVISTDYNEAHKKAYLTQMSEEEYNDLYDTQH